MTEAEWLGCTTLAQMMEVVQWSISERKLVLFGCACCYRQWSVIPDSCCRNAVQSAERFADGLCTRAELRHARDQVKEAHPNLFWYQECGCHAEAACYFAAFDTTAAKEMEAQHPLDPPGDYLTFMKAEVAGLIACAVSSPTSPTFEADWNREMVAQCAILRDIVGNPFRTAPAMDKSLLTPAVLDLTRQIYEQRAFDRTPELADALAAAGCRDAEVLGHLRSASVHVRGCWALDAVLRPC